MANVEKLTIGSDTYDLRDASAVHTVDSAMSSSSTNPVQNKVVKEYVDDAIQNEPYMVLGIASNFQNAVLVLDNFKNLPTTYADLVAHDDFKMALARPIIVDAGGFGNHVVQGLVLNMDGIPYSNHWTIVFPDGIVFNGTLLNGVEGDLTYDSSEDLWYLDNFSIHTPEFVNYTDEAITNISLVSTQVEANATEAATPANGDGLIFADSDDANKLKRMTNGFGTSTATFLRNDGTWAAPPSGEAPVSRIFHGTCSTAASTTAKVVTCPQFLTSDFVTGAIVFVTFTATNSGAVASLTLNVNGTGAKNIKYMRNAGESNLPAVGYLRANMTYRFVYNGTYWVCDTDYDADTVTMLTYRTFRVASDAGGSLYSYKLCALDNNGDLIPFNFVSSSPTTAYTKAITTHSFNPFRGFLYYSGTTTTSAGSGRDANEFRSAMQFDCRYSLNINSSGTAGSTALTAYDPVYVKALYTASTRLAKLVADTSNSNYLVRSSVVQALPSADPNTGLDDGTFYIYILLGQAYSKYQIDMFDNKIIYYWNSKAGMMTEFTGIIEADCATPADISTAIDALDTSVSGLSASKTITVLSEQNGIISASASDIVIDATQVATGTFASNRIYSDATMAVAIESGDSVIFADSSDANKVKRMSNGFDTTKTTEFLRRDGSWAAPPSGTNTTYTFADGTNGFTVTPSDGTAQTVNVTPSISEIKNDLTLLKEGTSPGDSHSLIFQRGTLTDNYNDWRLQDRSGFLYFDQRGSGSTSWANQVVFNTSGNVSATSFSGSGASLTSLNASNISSGTLNAARLPSGLEYTSNMTQYVNHVSTTTQYPSAKAVYDALDSITYKTGDQYDAWTPDATPSSSSYTVTGTCTQGTYSHIAAANAAGKAVFVIDDAKIFDYYGCDDVKVYELVCANSVDGLLTFVTLQDDANYRDEILIVHSTDEFDLRDKLPAPHTHISTQIEANATESAAVGTGDGLIFADSDDSNKLKRMTSGFDVSNNTSFLRQDGVWAVPAGGGGGTSGIFKGTCATGAAEDPKVVTCPEFTSEDLVKGAVIFVTFTHTNSASVNSVQMNVNGTGAKRIMQRKNTVVGTMTTNEEIIANQTYMFTYDGTYWVLSSDDDRTNVTALGNGHKNIGTTYRYQFLVSCSKDDTNTTDHKRALFAINAVNSGSTTYTKAFRTWSFDPFGVFAYWNSVDTVSSEGTFGDPTRLLIEGKVSGNYAFNVKQNGTVGTQGFVDNKAVYMKSKYDFVTQTATLWQDTASSNYLDRSGLVQELPTTNPNTSTDTYIYIYLGQAFGGDARTFYLLPYHPVYMWNEAKGRMDLFTGGPMEGSGTCELTDGSNVNITANYYKVGKQVTVSGTIPATSSTASSLSGLPFAAKDSAQLTLSWTDALLTTSVWGRLSVVSGSTNLYTTGYVKIGTTSSHNAGSWLSQVASPGVAFSLTYVTDVP